MVLAVRRCSCSTARGSRTWLVDPLVLRFFGVHRLLADRTVVRSLKAFSAPLIEALADLVRDGVHDEVERAGPKRLTVDLYRKRVSHKSRKNIQFELFDPADGHFEYSVVATNKTLSIPALWQFIAGRGAHEKTIAELKQAVAFDAIRPTTARPMPRGRCRACSRSTSSAASRSPLEHPCGPGPGSGPTPTPSRPSGPCASS